MKIPALFAAAVLGIALLAGCGSDDEPRPSGDSSQADEFTKDDFIDRMVKALREAESTHVTLAVKTGSETVSGEGDMRFGSTADDSAMDIDYATSGQEFTLRVVEGAVYVDLGAATQNKFFEVDTSDSNDPIAQQFSGLLDQMDPSASYEPFADAVSSVETKGDAIDIDGVSAQPYEIVVDTSKIDDLPAMDDVPRDQLPKEFRYVFFMGPDDLVRRVDFSLGGTTLKMTYADFGDVPEITVPAPDELTTQSPFASQS